MTDIEKARQEIAAAQLKLDVALSYLGETPAPETPDGYLTPHFRVTEMDCNHCGRYGEDASMELMDVLEDVRRHFGAVPVTINSGVRCETHNRNVGGAASSRHLNKYADAADIVVNGISPSSVASYLEATDPGNRGIGRYSSFTHIDVRGYSARWNG